MSDIHVKVDLLKHMYGWGGERDGGNRERESEWVRKGKRGKVYVSIFENNLPTSREKVHGRRKKEGKLKKNLYNGQGHCMFTVVVGLLVLLLLLTSFY